MTNLSRPQLHQALSGALCKGHGKPLGDRAVQDWRVFGRFEQKTPPGSQAQTDARHGWRATFQNGDAPEAMPRGRWWQSQFEFGHIDFDQRFKSSKINTFWR